MNFSEKQIALMGVIGGQRIISSENRFYAGLDKVKLKAYQDILTDSIISGEVIRNTASVYVIENDDIREFTLSTFANNLTSQILLLMLDDKDITTELEELKTYM